MLVSPTLLAGAAPTAPGQAPAPTPEQVEFFEKRVRPILAENCYACHGPAAKAPMGTLRLDGRETILRGGKRGPAIVPGKPEDSLLLRAVGYLEPGLQMPPKAQLSDEAIAALAEWVRSGAPWPDGGTNGRVDERTSGRQATAGRGSPSSTRPLVHTSSRPHWAFQPLRRETIPRVTNRGRVRTPVDAFVLAKLEAKGLAPAPRADRRTLIRRVTFDLTGLPPTPGEVEAFVNDPAPDAWSRVVERLLASPHYGERWGRHWLDLIRYAETDGHEFDLEKPNAFRYRDYVIRALNADVPYDQFVTEHVAGDLLPGPRRHPEEGFSESVIGTGFWWLGEGKHSPVDIREDAVERVENQIDVFTKAFLGLTVGCARCHDHKFDPIPTSDYYALAGFLKSSRYCQASIDPPEPLRAAIAELESVDRELAPVLLTAALRARSDALDRLPAYLRAASALLGAKPMEAAVAEAATQQGLDGALLERWVRYLREIAARDPGDPLYPLAAEARAPDGGGNSPSTPSTLAEKPADSTASNESTVVFEGFGGADYSGWLVEGEAFGSGPAQAWASRLETGTGRVLGLSPPGAADSGRRSPRLQGALRSRTFTIVKEKIHYRMAGRDAQLNLIVEGFQRIRDPIYGGLTLKPKSAGSLAWQTQDVKKWVGRRAYVELLDNGPGWLAVDRILFAHEPAPAVSPRSIAIERLRDGSTRSPEALAEAIAARIQAAAASPLGEHGAPLVDWLLRTDLLPSAPVDLSPDAGALLEKWKSLEASLPEPRRALALTEGTGENERVHLRGSHRNLGPEVPRRTLTALGGAGLPPRTSGSGRLALARHLLGPRTRPLLARVMVNRVWQHHFGTGSVGTPDDFGLRGERPTHPELLDWLAWGFASGSMDVWTCGRMGARTSGQADAVAPGPTSSTRPHVHTSAPPAARPWSLKALHRLILLSNTYQQSSTPAPSPNPKSKIQNPKSIDLHNRLLHRMPVRRLEAEAVRDAILAVSGRLDRRLFGPSVLPHLTPFMEGRGRPGTSGPLDGEGRRSIYLSVRRNFLTPMFLAFDYPIPFSTIGRRSISTVPAQALTLMNNPFVAGQAEFWAKRLLEKKDEAPAARVTRMYLEAFSRPPLEAELAGALKFLEERRSEPGATESAGWSDLAHVLFNLKEFIFTR